MTPTEIARKLSPAQRYGVTFLASGNVIYVDLIRNTGRSREWPTRATLKRLRALELVKVTTWMGGWDCNITDLGREVARELEAIKSRNTGDQP